MRRIAMCEMKYSSGRGENTVLLSGQRACRLPFRIKPGAVAERPEVDYECLSG